LYATILTIQDIIANKDNIFLCAKAFRDDANALMLQLAQEFDFDINNCGAWPSPVYKTSHNNKGTLTDDWTFYLHGSHCRFDNLKTGQIVVVCYTEKPEFGLLDSFFFYTYMQTTNEFKNLANWFENHSNVYDAIDILSEEGTLTKKPGQISGNYILAL
jgi:hypothetical protein